MAKSDVFKHKTSWADHWVLFTKKRRCYVQKLAGKKMRVFIKSTSIGGFKHGNSEATDSLRKRVHGDFALTCQSEPDVANTPERLRKRSFYHIGQKEVLIKGGSRRTTVTLWHTGYYNVFVCQWIL